VKAPDSTVAVLADGVVALSVERYLDELRFVAWLTRSLLVGLPGVGGDHDLSRFSHSGLTTAWSCRLAATRCAQAAGVALRQNSCIAPK